MRTLGHRILRLLAIALMGTALMAAAPTRVVSQTVGTDDLLMALAPPSQIAALSHLARDPEFSPYAQQAKRFPCLTNGEAEDILRFRPDLVLVASYTQASTVALLERAHVRVLKVDQFDSLSDLYATTRRIASALGREKRAEELIHQWQARVDALAVRLKGVRATRVLAVGFYPFTAGSGTTFQDICDHAGAVNVAAEAGLRGHVPTPSERVLTWNAEVLVVPGQPSQDLRQRLSKMLPYKLLPAFKQGRMVVIPDALMAATSHARLDAYEWVARALHPERFR